MSQILTLITTFKKIGHWPFQWKIDFNTDSSNQTQEPSFSHKVQMVNQPPLFFNQNVPHSPLKIKCQWTNNNKTIGPLVKLETLLPRACLITIYE